MLNVKQGSCESRALAEKFPGGPTGKTKPKNSNIKLPSTLSASSMKIHLSALRCRRPACCEYQLLKCFGLTQPENRTQVYRLSAQK